MALPFIVGAMMIAAGMTSYMKGTKAEDTNQEAKEMVNEARHNYCVARNRLQKAKTRACDSLVGGRTGQGLCFSERYDFFCAFGKDVKGRWQS